MGEQTDLEMEPPMIVPTANTPFKEKIEYLRANYKTCNGTIGFSDKGRSFTLTIYMGVDFHEAHEIKSGKRYPMELDTFWELLETAINEAYEIIDADRVSSELKPLPKQSMRTFAEQAEQDAEIDAENKRREAELTLGQQLGEIAFGIQYVEAGPQDEFRGYIMPDKDFAMQFRLANVTEKV